MTAFLKDAFHRVANPAQKGCWLVEELPLPSLCPGWIPSEVLGFLGRILVGLFLSMERGPLSFEEVSVQWGWQQSPRVQEVEFPSDDLPPRPHILAFYRHLGKMFGHKETWVRDDFENAGSGNLWDATSLVGQLQGGWKPAVGCYRDRYHL